MDIASHTLHSENTKSNGSSKLQLTWNRKMKVEKANDPLVQTTGPQVPVSLAVVCCSLPKHKI